MSGLVVCIAALLVPGGGHALLGQWRKALLFFMTLLALFIGGLALSHWTAIDPERSPWEAVAQAGLAGPAAAAWALTQEQVLTTPARWLDVGRLYVAVAGLLNIVCMTDAWGFALARGERVARVRDRRAQREARASALRARAASATWDEER